MRAPFTILHLRASTSFGGADSMLLSTCKQLDPERFKVKILTMFPKRLNSNYVYDRSKQLGLPCYLFKYRHKFSVRDLLRFLDFLNRHRVDLVHAHGYRENIMAALAARITKTATVTTLHGWTRGTIRKLIDLRSIRCLHRIIAVSPTVADELYATGIPKTRILYLPNSVDTDEFTKRPRDCHLKQEYGIENGQTVIGTAVRLSVEKGIYDFIKAAELVTEKCSNVKFLVVGDGPERSNFVRQIQKRGLSTFFVLPGYQEDMVAMYNLMDIYVSSSHAEALPRSVLEAASMEIPIVATDVGGVGNIVIDGKSGILVPPHAPELLARKIAQLIEDSSLRNTLGHNARTIVQRGFSIGVMVKKLETLYEEIIREVKRNK